MTTNNDENFLTPFETFLERLDKHDEQEKLFMLAGLVEMLRHTKSATDVLSAAELLASVPYVAWNQIPFSITKTLLSRGYYDDVKKLGVPEKHVATVIRSGFLLFLDALQADPTISATADLLWANVEIAAEASFPQQPEEPPLNPKLPADRPEVFSARLVRRVFEPVKFTPELAEKLRLLVVNYRGEMPDKRLGPELRGVAVSADGHFNVLLESGEFLEVPRDYAYLKISTAPEDFKNISPALLLALTAVANAFESLAVFDADQTAALTTGKLGKILRMHFCSVADVDDLRALERVFDISREAGRMGGAGATGPVGATVRFPIPASGNKAVILEAQQDSFGPYSIARLVEVDAAGKDVVLLRHETPRHYSLRGVYLFPLKDCLVSLTTIF